MEKLPLKMAFDAVREALPDMPETMRPLGHGHFGIAVGDDTLVQKILYRSEGAVTSEKSLRQFMREADILQRFSGQDMGGVEVPILLKPPRILEHEKFQATYSMTRVPGHTNAMMPANEGLAANYGEKYKSAGVLLARFHKAIERIDLGDSLPMGPPDGTSIVNVPFLDKEVNKKLILANRFLQDNIDGGNIHGDANLGNFIERNGVMVGLIDFSHAGYVKNRMMEFWTVPEQYGQEFIDGYQEESGEEIAMKVHAASLSMWTHAVHRPNISQEMKDVSMTKVPELLNKMAPVLGR